MDAAILVIDVNKGIQTQTAECIVLAEILKLPLIIALNKIDLIPENSKQTRLTKVSNLIKKSLSNTTFKSSPIVHISATQTLDSSQPHTKFIDPLVDAIKLTIAAFSNQNINKIGQVSYNDDCLLAFDHCFSLKGQGTVMTGTCLKGTLSVGDSLQVLPIGVQRKVKSIQVFKKSVKSITKGDRAGICLVKIESSDIERGFLASVNSINKACACIMPINIVPHYKNTIKSNSQFHISIGYETVVARITLFAASDSNLYPQISDSNYLLSNEFLAIDEIDPKSNTISENKSSFSNYFVLLDWKSPVYIPISSTVIASKLDTDLAAGICRLAFYGNPIYLISDKEYPKWSSSSLNLFRIKEKFGKINRIVDENNLIGNEMFLNSSVTSFVGFSVDVLNDLNLVVASGVIEGTFGQGDKFKVRFPRNTDLYKGLTETPGPSSDKTAQINNNQQNTSKKKGMTTPNLISELPINNVRLDSVETIKNKGKNKSKLPKIDLGSLRLRIKYRKFINVKSKIDQNKHFTHLYQ
ncbi:Selenocysteine-specific elongation factor [Smittium culicis]|uniref:Selenocysteine-specific elongation factor n=1 Tax=Smittium culicis TaxID=133412 RepID=A0A1R1Y148_9FUNG|nr:Selenocysteine-specific elongation factor [Smittium culicis]